jgi:hypothetical protein
MSHTSKRLFRNRVEDKENSVSRMEIRTDSFSEVCLPLEKR